MAGSPSEELPAPVGVIRRVDEIEHVEAFGRCALAELAILVPFDHGVFNDIDPVARQAHFDVHPQGARAPSWSFDTYDSYLPQNPIFQHVQRTGRGEARRLSDFVDQGQLHALPLYIHILAPLGVEYQVAFSISYRRPRILAFSLSRADRDFTDREVATLDLVRPHLSRTYRRLRDQGAQVHAFKRSYGLTQREGDILDELVAGVAVDAIALQLAIAEATVRKHIEHIYRKLGVANRAEATALALRIRRGGS